MNLLKTHIALCKIAGGAPSLKNQILCAVADNPGITQTNICKICEIKKTNATPLCKTLENEGLVERTKQKKFVTLKITEKGKAKLKEENAKINSKKYLKTLESLRSKL